MKKWGIALILFVSSLSILFYMPKIDNIYQFLFIGLFLAIILTLIVVFSIISLNKKEGKKLIPIFLIISSIFEIYLEYNLLLSG